MSPYFEDPAPENWCQLKGFVYIFFTYSTHDNKILMTKTIFEIKFQIEQKL